VSLSFLSQPLPYLGVQSPLREDGLVRQTIAVILSYKQVLEANLDNQNNFSFFLHLKAFCILLSVLLLIILKEALS